jgi:hypothetical protein
MIDDADRVDAETRDVMNGLHRWLSRGGFEPDWKKYPTGTRRYRKAYGKKAGARKKTTRPGTRRAHAAVARAVPTGMVEHWGVHSANGIKIGDIVQRADQVSKNRYVVTDIRGSWILTRRISGSGGPGIIQFPSATMLKKVG